MYLNIFMFGTKRALIWIYNWQGNEFDNGMELFQKKIAAVWTGPSQFYLSRLMASPNYSACYVARGLFRNPRQKLF